MDEDDPVLSHQAQAVSELAKHFNDVTVLTGRQGKFKEIANVRVVSSRWISNERLKSVLIFYSEFFKIIISKKPNAIFSHMTEVQSCLIAPLVRILRIKHYLWYAHKSLSPYLRWNLIWINQVFTSTLGSFPVITPKLSIIGQAIDPSAFPFKTIKSLNNVSKLVHLGRFDPSKNISIIIEAALGFKLFEPNVQLTLIGSPSSEKSMREAKLILAKFSAVQFANSIKFVNKIKRTDVSNELLKYEVFIHAYNGSLDKTLLEATLTGLPVVTINAEYLSIFGAWSNSKHLGAYFLIDELRALASINRVELENKLVLRRNQVISGHTLTNWGSLIAKYIKNDTN